MNRRTFIAAVAAGVGCAALPAVDEDEWLPSNPLMLEESPVGSVFGVQFQGRLVWFHKLFHRGEWSYGHVVGDSTARGECRYKIAENGDILLDWLTVMEPVATEELGSDGCLRLWNGCFNEMLLQGRWNETLLTRGA